MSDHPTWKVAPDGQGWAVLQNGTSDVISRHAGKEAALREARVLAERSAPSHMVVHDDAGEVVWSAIFSGNGNDPEHEDLPWPSDAEVWA